jgi:hypothetical protein
MQSAAKVKALARRCAVATVSGVVLLIAALQPLGGRPQPRWKLGNAGDAGLDLLLSLGRVLLLLSLLKSGPEMIWVHVMATQTVAKRGEGLQDRRRPRRSAPGCGGCGRRGVGRLPGGGSGPCICVQGTRSGDLRHGCRGGRGGTVIPTTTAAAVEDEQAGGDRRRDGHGGQRVSNPSHPARERSAGSIAADVGRWGRDRGRARRARRRALPTDPLLLV